MADSLVYKLQNIKEDRNTNLKPENLKAGITCLGVTGTLEQNTGSDVEPIYVTSDYTVKTIPVDLNETIDSISTYEDYVAVHTTLNKLKVYNKSDLSTPFITKDNVIPYGQGCYYIYGFEDNKLYITNGFNGSSTQDYYIIDLSNTTITHATYTDPNRIRTSGDLNINMTNNIVHFKHGSYLSIYSYDLTTGFTELSDEYNAVNSYIGNNVYEDLESIVIIQSNGSKTKHRVIPSGGEGAICGVNFTKTKAFLFMSGSNIIVYSLNDDYSMNEMLSTVSLPITFDDGIPKLQCLNSNYYYLSYKNNNYILKFDEDTNQFSIVVTNEKLYVRNSLPYIENQNQYIDFQQGDTEIGILYNGNQYLTRDKYTGYTNSDLLTGNTMYDIAHQIVAGTMANNETLNYTPSTQNQTIPQGYTAGGIVQGDQNLISENIKKDISIFGVTGTYSGDGTSDATATANMIQEGYTAYTANGKITGTAKNENSHIFTSDANVYAVEGDLLELAYEVEEPRIFQQGNGALLRAPFSKVADVIELTSDKLVEGNTVLGIEGTAHILDTSDATATAEELPENVTAYVNGEKITGTAIDLPTFMPMFDMHVSDVGGDLVGSIDYTVTMPRYMRVGSKIQTNVGINESEIATAIDLTADKIVEGNTILGVSGTATSGIDTSDADATADDIVLNKTAYVNGEKITGSINTKQSGSLTSYNSDNNLMSDQSSNRIGLNTVIDEDILLRSGANVTIYKSMSTLATQLGITADKIKKGETILGITGTYEGTMTSEEYESAVDTTEQILGLK